MPTNTTNLNLKKPIVGADEDLWGGYINDNLDDLDDYLSGTAAIPALDVTGDVTAASLTSDNMTVGATTFPNAGALSNRNVVTNGGMTVAQRSTSVSGMGNGTNSYKTVDRYTTYISGLGTWTQSQDTDAPDGFGYSLKMLCTTADAAPAAGDRMLIQTKIEGQDVQRLGFGNTANTYTVSFYVKSNVTGTYILEQYGDSASATGNNISKAYTINAANTWERKVITLNVDSGAMTANNQSGLVLTFWLGSGTNYTSGTLNTSWSNPVSADRAVGQVNLASATNNYWQVTGFQVEVGDIATPFEHRSYGDELARCQRYFQRFNGLMGNKINGISNINIRSSNSKYGVIHHPVVPRAQPTVGYSNLSDFILYAGASQTTPTDFASQGTSGAGSTELYIETPSFGSPGWGGWLRLNSTTGYLDFDMEL